MNQQLRNLLGLLVSVLVIFLVVYVGINIQTQLNPASEIGKTPTITMSAEGKVSARPDTARVSVGLTSDGTTASDVQAENDKKVNAIIDYLKSQGVSEDDIQTSNYSLYPQYDYNYSADQNRPRIVGYSINQTVDAKIREISKASEIVGGLTKAGANQINSLQFYIDDPDQLKGQARDEAVTKARDKAQTLANSLGVKLGRVVSFNENSGSTVGPYPYALEAGYGAGGGGSPIQAGTQDVTVSVTVIYEIK